MQDISVELGYLKPEDIPGHPQGHVLTQALRTGLEEVNTRIERVESGDVFLLCSDGLYDMVTDKRILEIVKKSDGVEGACQSLVEEALRNGGRDNVTVILVEVI
jgi:serine/threonine protein phosphatase PrpC